MQRFEIFHGLFQFVQKFARSWNASRCNASTVQRFNGSTRSQAALCQLNRGGDNDGDDGGSKFDARYTRSIGCHRNNTNTAGNKSSTAADSTRKDNNYSALDKRNSRLGTQ